MAAAAMAAAAMKPAPAVKPAAVESTTSDARVPAGRKASRCASMIDPAERAGTGAWAAMEPWAAAEEMAVIDERAAVRDKGVVVVLDPPVVPVGAPVMPSPAESAEKADPKTESERNPPADGLEAAVPIPPSA